MKNIFCIVATCLVAVSQSACASLARGKNSSPVVAIIDTGFDTGHPALQVPVVDSYDFSREAKDIAPYILRTYLSGDIYARVKSLVELVPE